MSPAHGEALFELEAVGEINTENREFARLSLTDILTFHVDPAEFLYLRL